MSGEPLSPKTPGRFEPTPAGPPSPRLQALFDELKGHIARLEHASYCWRVGGPVDLSADGTCPECGFGHTPKP